MTSPRSQAQAQGQQQTSPVVPSQGQGYGQQSGPPPGYPMPASVPYPGPYPPYGMPQPMPPQQQGISSTQAAAMATAAASGHAYYLPDQGFAGSPRVPGGGHVKAESRGRPGGSPRQNHAQMPPVPHQQVPSQAPMAHRQQMGGGTGSPNMQAPQPMMNHQHQQPPHQHPQHQSRPSAHSAQHQQPNQVPSQPPQQNHQQSPEAGGGGRWGWRRRPRIRRAPLRQRQAVPPHPQAPGRAPEGWRSSCG